VKPFGTVTDAIETVLVENYAPVADREQVRDFAATGFQYL
jgi:hypothetical protein